MAINETANENQHVTETQKISLFIFNFIELFMEVGLYVYLIYIIYMFR